MCVGESHFAPSCQVVDDTFVLHIPWYCKSMSFLRTFSKYNTCLYQFVMFLGKDAWALKLIFLSPGAGCSKLTMSLVNVSLKFQMLISQINLYFLLKKCVKLLQCKSFSHFFNKKIQCIWL